MSEKIQRPIVEALEPRILYSADPITVLFDSPTDDFNAADTPTLRDTVDHPIAPLSDSNNAPVEQSAAAVDVNTALTAQAEQGSLELVFVDTSAPDYQQLLDDLLEHAGPERTFEITTIDSSSNGIDSISETLMGFRNIDAVHIISHGSEGELTVGATTVDLSYLQAHGEQIGLWSEAFSADGDILIYGCDLGSSDSGKELLTSLARLIDTDIAASDDATGHASLGGDWQLETVVGQVETEALAATAWQGLLAAGDPTDLSGGIELNTDGGSDAYLLSSNGGAILGGLSEVTLEIQFSIDAPKTDNMLLSYAVSGQANEIFLNVHSTGQIQFSIESDNQISTGIYQELLDGEQHALAVSWQQSSGAVAFYVDGEWVESFTDFKTNTVIDGGGTLVFGQEQDSVNGGFDLNQSLSATYYDVRIWDEVRSDLEIALNHQQKLESSSLPSALVANWQMDGFNGSNQVVDVVSANNLSIAHVSAAGFTPSTPVEYLHVDEHAATGTSIGVVIPTDADLTEDIVSDGLFLGGTDPGNYSLVSTGQTFGDWTVRTGTIDVLGSYAESSPLGGHSVELSGVNAGGIYQTLDTTAGQEYQVIFALSGNWNLGESVKDLRVSAAGQSQDFSVEEPDGWNASSNMLFSNHSFTFTASGSSTDLDFLSLDAGDYASVIADIRVIEVPAAVSQILSNDATLSYDAGTGKFYRYVNDYIAWDSAQNAAIASKLNGIDGQLATIQSAYENELLRNLSTSGWGTWIGASDASVEGDFHWYDGTTEGDQFWSGGQSGSALSGSYTNFDSFQPDFSGDALYMLISSGAWDDAPISPGDVNSYFIEWDASEVLSNYTFTLTDPSNNFDIDANSGEITVAATNTLDYESNSSHNLSIEVTDAAGDSYSELMAVQVNDVLAVPDSYSLNENAVLNTAAPGVLANDVGGGSKAVVSYDDSSTLGTVVVNADGSFSYNPNGQFDSLLLGQSGSDSFTYTFDDGSGNQETVSVSLTIDGVTPIQNAASVILSPGAQSVAEDQVLTFSSGGGNALTVSDSLPGTNSLMQVTLSTTDGTLALATTTGLSFVEGTNNSASFVINGSESALNAAFDGMTFTPDSDYSGSVTLNASAALAADLQGHYSFDGGTAGDASSGTSHDGALVGGANTSIDGGRGEVLNLDAAGEYVRIDTPFGNPSDVTLAAWVNFSSLPANGGEVISLGNDVALRINDGVNGVSAFFWDGTTHQFIGNNITLNASEWHHVAFSFDDANDTQTLFIDGEIVATSNYTQSVAWTGWFPQTTVGTHAQLSESNFDFQGQIDEARVYTRSLSPHEIAALAADSDSASASLAVTVTAVNDAPTITSDGGAAAASVNAAETQTAVTTVTANDADTGDTPTFSISGGADSALFNIQASSGVLTFVSGRDFETFSDANTDGIYEVEVSADDGNGGSDSQLISVTVSNTNDAPVNTLPGLQSTSVNTSLVFSLANGNAIRVDDVDAGAGELAITLTATQGSLTLDSTGGLTFSTGDGSADTSMSFTGTAANINNALNGLSFTPDNNFEGTSTLTLTSNDQGASGAGGSLTDSDAMTIQVGSSSFQQGANGYTGTEDTYVKSTSPTTDRGAEVEIYADDDSLSSAGLIRFGDIFGNGANQIPPGSVINSASLSIYVTHRDLLDDVSVHRMLSAWDESSTYNSLGSGVQSNGIEAAATAELTLDAGALGWSNIGGLQSTVQAWSDGAANHGWAFISDDADGWAFASSEHADNTIRPYLTIDYTAPDPAVVSTTPGNVSFIENAAPQVIDPGLTVTDNDSTAFTGAEISISSNYNPAQDQLNFVNQNGISGAWDGASGTLTLSGNASVADYQAALRSVSYSNNSEDPSTATRTVSFAVSDALVDSNTAVRSIDVQAVNDAPTFTSTESTTATEDAAYSYTITTADADDAGANLTITAATLPSWLTLSDNGDGTATLSGTPSNAEVSAHNVSLNVSDGALSEVQNFTITVANVNDAPVLDNSGDLALTNITEDAVGGAGQTLASILLSDGGSPINDVDAGASQGIAITERNNGRGMWQYSVDGGSSWANVGTVSETSALLLRDTDLVRFDPDAKNGISQTFSFRAWDQTVGAAGSKVDASTSGGTSAFSSADESAAITVASINDAPVLDNSAALSLNAQNEDSAAPIGAVGTLITDLVSQGGNVSDVDASSQTGIAITAAATANGNWWYSTDNGSNWNALGSVAENNARLLNANSSTRLYFEPNADFNGTISDAIEFRAWDRSTGSSGALIDISSTGTGGTSAFSTTTETADLSITAVNDSPSNVGTMPTAVTVVEDSWSSIDLSAIDLSDVDAATGDLSLTLTTATGGQLSAAADASIDFSGSTATSVHMTGTLAELNSYLDVASNLSYLHDTAQLSGNAADTLAVVINDNGNTGTGGGGDIPLGTVSVEISGVNDAPTLSGGSELLFSDSFETPDISDSVDADPPGWIGDTHPSYVTHVDQNTGDFTTPFGDQAMMVYKNSTIGATTDASALNAALAADTRYTLDFNVARDGPVGEYVVQLLAIAGDNSETLLASVSGTSTETDFSETDALTFTADGSHTAVVGDRLAIRLLHDPSSHFSHSVFFDNVQLRSNVANFVEDGPAVLLGERLDASDAELDAANAGSGNYSGATLTIVRDSGADSDDVFSFDDGNGITLSSNSLIKNSQVIATVDTNTTPGELLIAFTDGNGQIPTSSDVDNILRQITYANSSDTPPTTVQLAWTLNDGNAASQGSGGALSASGNTSVDITASNDNPGNTGNFPSDIIVTEDQSSNVDLSSINLSDADHGGNDLTVTLNTSTGGKLTAISAGGVTVGGTGTGTVTLTGALANLNSFLDTASNIQYQHGTANTYGNDADSLEIIVNDGGNTGAGGGSDQVLGTVNVDITAVNDEQVLSINTGVTVAEASTGTVLTTAMLETTDVDNTSAQVVYTLNSAPINGVLYRNSVALTITDTFNQADIDAGLISYDHDGSETVSDGFNFSVDDGTGASSSGSFNLTITPQNDLPVATGNTVVATEDLPLLIGAADFSFSDAESDALASVTITGLSLNGGSLSHSAGAVTVSNGMTITAAQLADLTFTSALNDATNSSFSYTVNDADTGVASATMNITVNAVNDVPVATGNTVVASEDVPLLIAAADFSFSDTENDSLASVTLTGLNLNGGTLTHSAGAVSVSNGMTITAAQLADLTFTSAPNDSTDSSFSYTVNDAGTGISSATMNITVNAVNDAPVATGNTVVALEDVTLIIGPGDFIFSDTESDSLVSVTITALNLNGGTLTHSAGTVSVSNGMTVTAAELADLSFTPALNNNAPASFDYAVNDADLGLITATMNITVTPVNDLPVATGNTLSTPEDQPLLINAGEFLYTDIESDALSSITVSNLQLNGGTLSHSGGTVTVSNGMQILAAQLIDLSFNPAPQSNLASSFDYQVNDNDNGVISATLHITVVPSNDAPVILSNGGGDTASAQISENHEQVTTVVASDADIGDAIAYAIAGGADAGLFGIDPNTGELRFTDAPNFEASQDANRDNHYEVEVTASDGNGGNDQQALSIAVLNQNESPVALSLSNESIDEFTDTANGFVLGLLSASDEDFGDTLSFSLIGGADVALFSLAGDGSSALVLNDGVIDYGLQSAYEVVVRATDAGGASVDRVFNITVTPRVISPPTEELPEITTTTPPSAEASQQPPEPALSGEELEPLKTTARAEGSPDRSSSAINMRPIHIDEIVSIAAELNTQYPQGTVSSTGQQSVLPLKHIDLANLQLSRLDPTNTPSIAALSVVQSERFAEEFKRMTEEVDRAFEQEKRQHQFVTEISSGVMISLTAGFVSWMLKSSSLLASFMSAVPAWKRLDPLLILVAKKRQSEALAEETAEERRVSRMFD